MELFRALGLSEGVLSALVKKGFTKPSPIQERTIPTLLSTDKDVVGQAQTGTGKTAAFGLPLVELLDDTKQQVQALVLCPTRELAVQVAEEILSFRGAKRLDVLPVYGGQSYEIQIRGLKKGAQIVVGTPGRVRDHIAKGTLKLNTIKYFVLDECDEMLNMGFEEEVRQILKGVPEDRRMLLFSATMPPNILKLVKTFIKPGYELVEVKKEQVTTEQVDQIYYELRDSDRFEGLCRIIDTNPTFYGIVFCKTKMETDLLASRLNDRGYEAEGIHGDVTQSQRELILKSFKAKKLRILVATDVAARGIDVNDLTHVVNYQLPQDPESYVHRIGRTGRAGKKGVAITLVAPSNRRDFGYIQQIAKTAIRKEVLPTVEDIIAVKKDAFKSKIQVLLAQGATEEYNELADELLAESSTHAELVAALLKYSVKDELSVNNYAEVADVNDSNGRAPKGSVRLFIAKGRDDNFNPQRLLEFLEQEGNVNRKVVGDIRVFDQFSFVNVPAGDAEMLLTIFGKTKGNQKPLITRAKEKDGGNGGGGFGGNRFEGRDGGNKKHFSDRKERHFEKGGSNAGFSDRKPSFGGSDRRDDKGNFKKRNDSGSGFKQRERNDSGSFKQRERKPTSSFSDGNNISKGDKNRAIKDFEAAGQFKKKSGGAKSSFEPKYNDDLMW